LEELSLDAPLAETLRNPPRAGVALHWLGQAGFAVQGAGRVVIIDPYLSDSLGLARMMPSPLAPEAARGVDAVLCTHRHADHMDPGTLPGIATASPECMFVVPRAERDFALGLGVPELRLKTMDSGETLRLVDGIQVDAIAAAHEDLAKDDKGQLLHLGYILTIDGLRIYHSGDCVPYEGLEEALRASAADVALMPVNGRDAFRTSRGIIGNFHLEETIQICRNAGIPLLFCHHWGLFDFNTIDPQAALKTIRQLAGTLRCVLPRVGARYLLRKA